MGIAERKSREKDERRRAILEAARRLIARRGVEGTSMNQLAESTELNKATLYLYFEDKDDLVDALVYEGLLLLEREYQQAGRQPLSGIARVLNLVRSTFAFYKKHPVYFHVLHHQERRRASARRDSPFAAKGNEAAARVFDAIAKGLEQGIEDGSIRGEIDIPMFLVLLYAQTYGVTHTIHAKQDIYRDVFHLDPTAIERSALGLIEYQLRSDRSTRSKGKAIPWNRRL